MGLDPSIPHLFGSEESNFLLSKDGKFLNMYLTGVCYAQNGRSAVPEREVWTKFFSFVFCRTPSCHRYHHRLTKRELHRLTIRPLLQLRLPRCIFDDGHGPREYFYCYCCCCNNTWEMRVYKKKRKIYL